MICSKNGIGSSNLAIKKRPLLVFGKIGTKSRAVRSGFKRSSRSFEMRSVKSSVLPTGISLRAFLIQKRITIGVVEKPIKSQKSGFLRKMRAMPPARSAINNMISKAMKAGLSRRCFSWASLTRGFLGS